MTNAAPIPIRIERDAQGHEKRQRWDLPTDGDYLRMFLTDMFERYWDRIIFGPILDGIAYEWTCPRAPNRFEMQDGYLTIGFGGPHFHMCLAPGAWPDTPEGRERMPGAASIVRSLDPLGHPNSWAFEMQGRERPADDVDLFRQSVSDRPGPDREGARLEPAFHVARHSETLSRP